MSGFEVTEAIRQIEKMGGGHLPIIAMTAHALVGDRERCLSAGMDDYICKPIEPPLLFAALERVMTGQPSLGEVPSMPAPNSDKIIDLPAALARIDGDADLLLDVLGLFRRDCPKLLDDIREAVAQDDSPALERGAHKLKGALSAFCAHPASAAADVLEGLGRSGAAGQSVDAFRLLEAELARLGPVLDALCKGQLTCAS
jgi:HPt (histidine-containing phosphotransfer) domain-containing protein